MKRLYKLKIQDSDESEKDENSENEDVKGLIYQFNERMGVY